MEKALNRGELIGIIEKIDQRIASLHHCSAEDFRQLNLYLKEYHSKTKKIFSNAFSIFEMVGGTRGAQILADLNSVSQRIRTGRDKVEEKNEHTIHVLEAMLAKFILLDVNTRNFKQDLTTFKFLISSFNLLSDYGELDEGELDIIQSWEVYLGRLKLRIPVLQDTLEGLKGQLYSIISESKTFEDGACRGFRNLLKEVDGSMRIMAQKNSESVRGLPELTRKTDNASKSIGHIVTHLQYHDIIWQKIDHIKQTHSGIIEELRDDQDNFHRIGDISELQAAQLILVNKEYQSAIEMIMSNFHQIASELTAVTQLSHEFSFDQNASESTLINQVKARLDEGIQILDKNSYTGLATDLQVLGRQVGDMAEELSTLAAEIPVLTSLGSARKHNVADQLFCLLKELARKIGRADQTVREIGGVIVDLNEKENSSDWGHELEKERIEMMLNISQMLDGLDDDQKILDDLLGENKRLSEQIQDQIRTTLQKVDYYDFFEKVIEDIILKLNILHLNLYKDDQTAEGKRMNLDEIRKSYTMKSERIVHDMVDSGKQSRSGEEIHEAGPGDEDDSLELF